MFAHNLWYWIINSGEDFLLTFFLPFLPRHVDWGLAQTIILLMALMEGVQLIFAARKILARIIRYATLIGLLA